MSAITLHDMQQEGGEDSVGPGSPAGFHRVPPAIPTQPGTRLGFLLLAGGVFSLTVISITGHVVDDGHRSEPLERVGVISAAWLDARLAGCDADRVWNIATRLVRKGFPRTAVRATEPFIRDCPPDAQVWGARLDAHEQLKNKTQSLNDLDHLVLLKPWDSMLWENRGRLRLEGGDVAGAESDFQQAISVPYMFGMGRPHIPVHVDLAKLQLERGDPCAAVSTMNRLGSLASLVRFQMRISAKLFTNISVPAWTKCTLPQPTGSHALDISSLKEDPSATPRMQGLLYLQHLKPVNLDVGGQAASFPFAPMVRLTVVSPNLAQKLGVTSSEPVQFLVRSLPEKEETYRVRRVVKPVDIRLGEFLVPSVEVAISETPLENVDGLLGDSFLDRVDFDVNEETLTLIARDVRRAMSHPAGFE